MNKTFLFLHKNYNFDFFQNTAVERLPILENLLHSCEKVRTQISDI